MAVPSDLDEEAIEVLRISPSHETGGLFNAMKFRHVPHAQSAKQLRGRALRIWTLAKNARRAVLNERDAMMATRVDTWDEDCLEAALRIEERPMMKKSSK